MKPYYAKKQEYIYKPRKITKRLIKELMKIINLNKKYEQMANNFNHNGISTVNSNACNELCRCYEKRKMQRIRTSTNYSGTNPRL